MSSYNSTPAPRRGSGRVLTINWKLLWRRLRAYVGQLFTSLRHKAANTEYIPPAWMQRFRLTWFRIGLMALAVFVFTQKQVDFTVSMGKEGLAIGHSEGRHSAAAAAGLAANSSSTASMSPLTVSGIDAAPTTTANKTWDVNALDAATVRAYVNRFERVAKGEEIKYNVPAPANMALAILYSEAGQATSAKRDNNHFGTFTADGYYENAWMNWRAHSERLNKRFPKLADNSVNYQQWVAALAKTSYSSDRKLADKIMDIVERFNLDRL
ncbi:glucosaminidase domain-containing protein [Neolewinella persica]|uniref:glucosaminidase domain-containing protein n=1 Tax=Neolewinella persica TaxID=70998 RepID=UPI0003656799|nr:glucosaminidase domain-containing protein [Neolewinella persica]